jgi:hypothetical protein
MSIQLMAAICGAMKPRITDIKAKTKRYMSILEKQNHFIRKMSVNKMMIIGISL